MVRVGWGMTYVYKSPHIDRSTMMCVRTLHVCEVWLSMLSFLGSFHWKPGRNNQLCAASQGSFKTGEETQLLKGTCSGKYWTYYRGPRTSRHARNFQQFLVWTRDTKIYLKCRFSWQLTVENSLDQTHTVSTLLSSFNSTGIFRARHIFWNVKVYFS